MIFFYNPHGKICITERYFAELINSAMKNTVGVAGMAQQSTKDCFKAFLDPKFSQTGVHVVEENGKLLIDLHIKVLFGVNIPQTVKSITQNVCYTVERATGFVVKRVNVSVDGVVS